MLPLAGLLMKAAPTLAGPVLDKINPFKKDEGDIQDNQPKKPPRGDID